MVILVVFFMFWGSDWAPWSEVYVDMDNFLSEVWLNCLFVKKEDTPCKAQAIHGNGILALGNFQLAQSFYIHDQKDRK